MLLMDPSTRLYTALSGGKYPVSREWMVLADLFDLQAKSKSKRQPKPYPRPWPEKSLRMGGKKSGTRSRDEVRAILRPLN